MLGILRWFYPIFVGILLGLLQTGLYFQLSFTLSSSFQTFLMVTVSWLTGSVLGITLAKRFQLNPSLFLLVGLMAYFACAALLVLAPYNTGLWFVYALLIILVGLYPGVFFNTMQKYYSAQVLFFRENNGFIIGLITGTLLFMLLGRSVLWIFPSILTGLLLLLGDAPFQTKLTEGMP